MTASSLSPERLDELAALRRRAYGPDADIEQDQDAVARLQELEDLARPGTVADAAPPVEGQAPTSVDAAVEEAAAPIQPETAAVIDVADVPPAPMGAQPAGAGAASVSSGDDRSATDAAAAAETKAETAPPVEQPAPKGFFARIAAWWRRIPRWTIAVVAVIVGAVASVGLGAAASAQPAARLGIDSSRVGSDIVFLPEGALVYYELERDDIRLHEAFGDLQVVSGINDSDQECLFAAVGDRWLNGGCAPAEFGAVFDITDDYGLQELTDPDLPQRSTIRLILKGEVVEVWVHVGEGPRIIEG
ncbi:hypothetical protein [Microbacterium sp.]|uniref:hypothetical protein n=1 Tax=Microbacterium sp. TaxID=51671 RepID=UPI002C58A62A|nr:hypothetical protein [Microbacterium sp.]HWL78304.1 hypothetical protein [Microbacterium sp.]